MNSFWKMFVLGFVVATVSQSHVRISDTCVTLTYGGYDIAYVVYADIPWQLYYHPNSFPNMPK